MMRGELGGDYTEALRRRYDGRVPGGADLVTYWFEKARAQIEAGQCGTAGLVSTNSIRGGSNRKVLERITDSARIFEAWSDESWVNDGAAVRVSLICFTTAAPNRHSREYGNPVGESAAALDSGLPSAPGMTASLDGRAVSAIHADLTAGEGLNLSIAKLLPENSTTCFVGTTKKASFDMPGELARQWLQLPNVHHQPNSEVVKPWINAADLVQRPSDTWIIDFGVGMLESDAALYDAPFMYALKIVKPEKMLVTAESEKRYWWRLARTAPDMRQNLSKLSRYISTPIHSKYRLFVWTSIAILPSHACAVIARADNTTFGILHSRFHELWSLRLGSSLEDRPRYTPTTTFETFPFPPGLTPRDTANAAPDGTIAIAAQRLNQLRDAWLNPLEWVDWQRTPEEERAGFPLRPVAKAGHEADLKKRTLTNLYNARPAWLDHAHKALDAAVAAAYDWTDYTPAMPNEEILRRLLALNLQRAGNGHQR
jgi:type II restriction/modification system DNA methylase subunit YeeA